jgi:hypothetical protein
MDLLLLVRDFAKKNETNKILYLPPYNRLNILNHPRIKIWKNAWRFNCDCGLFGTKYGCFKVVLYSIF